jgi:hypothetical protein
MFWIKCANTLSSLSGVEGIKYVTINKMKSNTIWVSVPTNCRLQRKNKLQADVWYLFFIRSFFLLEKNISNSECERRDLNQEIKNEKRMDLIIKLRVSLCWQCSPTTPQVDRKTSLSESFDIEKLFPAVLKLSLCLRWLIYEEGERMCVFVCVFMCVLFLTPRQFKKWRMSNLSSFPKTSSLIGREAVHSC